MLAPALLEAVKVASAMYALRHCPIGATNEFDTLLSEAT
jgi:hypothetical protein